MRLDGKTTCSDCSKEFEWMTIIAEPARSSIYSVETIDKPQARVVEKRGHTYFMNIFCPHCRRFNAFEHKE